MNAKKTIFLLFFTLLLSVMDAQTAMPACEKCNEKPIEVLEKNIDGVTSQMVAEFLCTFHESCLMDMHYVEYANRLLFWMLKRYPNFVIIEMDANPTFSDELILNQIKSPLNLDQDLKFIYNEVSKVKSKSKFKNQILSALKIAAEKTGVEIN